MTHQVYPVTMAPRVSYPVAMRLSTRGNVGVGAEMEYQSQHDEMAYAAQRRRYLAALRSIEDTCGYVAYDLAASALHAQYYTYVDPADCMDTVNHDAAHAGKRQSTDAAIVKPRKPRKPRAAQGAA